MVAFLLVTALYAIVYIPVAILIEYWTALIAIPVAASACLILAMALRRGLRLVVICNGYLFVLSVLISFLWLSTGGIVSTPNDPAFSALYPAIALLLLGRRWALFWLVAAIALVFVNGIPGLLGVELPTGMAPKWVDWFLILSLIGHAVLLFIFVSIFETSRDRAHKQLQVTNVALTAEQEKTESLLLNILPAEVAEELKLKGHAEAHEFDQCTILFSDFQNFTAISENMTPTDLVAELNACFYAFDAIMEQFELEKIKTIGDAYMAASGLAHSESLPVNVIRAAINMQDFMKKHRVENLAAGKPAFVMRAGIHTGPVVAGIVGVKKFQYDVWGDTVNTASRMETSGEIGEVNISQATHQLVKQEPDLLFTPRGKVNVKGKGDLEMFFVQARPNLQTINK
jgi:class 3 adenylate cyclase